jgi:hypothetical protein
MKFDIDSILEMAGAIGVAFWFIGFCTLLVAVRKARLEFRVKGYLRTPSGIRWLRFLLMKQYDHFGNPGTRFFFGIAHFCLMGMIVALMAVVLLLGSELLLKNMYGLPEGGTYVTPGSTFLK